MRKALASLLCLSVVLLLGWQTLLYLSDRQHEKFRLEQIAKEVDWVIEEHKRAGETLESYALNKLEQAKDGRWDSLYAVASGYEHGSMGFPADLGKSLSWHKQAGEAGHLLSQVIMGLSKELLSKDYWLATRWYKCSAKGGSVWGQALLGNSYLEGRGVPVDYVEAYAWLNVASGRLKSKRRPPLWSYLWEILPGDPVETYVARVERGVNEATRQLSTESLLRAQDLSQEYWRLYADFPWNKILGRICTL